MNNFFTIGIWIWLSIESVIYVITGILLYTRSHKRAICVRSPKLLQISHWSNFFEVLIVLIALNILQGYNKSYNTIIILCTVVHFLTHYLFFIPFILRSYRLYTIYKIDQNFDIKDKKFVASIKKTREKFLIKTLALISLPFFLVCILAYTLNNNYNFFEYRNGQVKNDNVQIIVNSIALLIGFIEQIISIFAINALRNIRDDFKMASELCFVNVVWIITCPNLILNNYSYFSYQILLRNNLVFLFSSLYPLALTFKSSAFNLMLTEESLKSLELILQHKLTLEAFESFLKSSLVQYEYKPGLKYLNLWLQCELSKYNPEEYIEKINESASLLKITENTTLLQIQSSAFKILEDCFFPLFFKSPQYLQCLKEVNRQKLYIIHLQLTRESYEVSDFIS